MKYSTYNEIFNKEKILGTFYNSTIKHYTALYVHDDDDDEVPVMKFWAEGKMQDL